MTSTVTVSSAGAVLAGALTALVLAGLRVAVISRRGS